MSNKIWKQEGDKYVLYFTPFYDSEKVAELFFEDVEWRFNSDVLEHYDEWLEEDDLESAQMEIERMLLEHYKSERDYYADLIEKFEGQEQ